MKIPWIAPEQPTYIVDETNYIMDKSTNEPLYIEESTYIINGNTIDETTFTIDASTDEPISVEESTYTIDGSTITVEESTIMIEETVTTSSLATARGSTCTTEECTHTRQEKLPILPSTSDIQHNTDIERGTFDTIHGPRSYRGYNYFAICVLPVIRLFLHVGYMLALLVVYFVFGIRRVDEKLGVYEEAFLACVVNCFVPALCSLCLHACMRLPDHEPADFSSEFRDGLAMREVAFTMILILTSWAWFIYLYVTAIAAAKDVKAGCT